MKFEFNVRTSSQTGLQEITGEVRNIVKKSGIDSGICMVYCPHTTAGITVNEGADPAVKRDIDYELNKVIPFKDAYQHFEGNSAAHIKSTLVGASEFFIIDNRSLLLGTWQTIYFAEFDGPRNRTVIVKIIKG